MDEFTKTFYLIRSTITPSNPDGKEKVLYYGVKAHPICPEWDSLWWYIKEYGYLSETGAKRSCKRMKQYHEQCRDAAMQVESHDVIFPSYDEYIRQCGSRLRSARARKDKT